MLEAERDRLAALADDSIAELEVMKSENIHLSSGAVMHEEERQSFRGALAKLAGALQASAHAQHTQRACCILSPVRALEASAREVQWRLGISVHSNASKASSLHSVWSCLLGLNCLSMRSPAVPQRPPLTLRHLLLRLFSSVRRKCSSFYPFKNTMRSFVRWQSSGKH